MPFDDRPMERPERPERPEGRKHQIGAHADICALCGAFGPALLIWPETPCNPFSAAAINEQYRQSLRRSRYDYRRG